MSHPLAMLYSTSVLEQHHFRQAELLLGINRLNIFCHLRSSGIQTSESSVQSIGYRGTHVMSCYYHCQMLQAYQLDYTVF